MRATTLPARAARPAAAAARLFRRTVPALPRPAPRRRATRASAEERDEADLVGLRC